MENYLKNKEHAKVGMALTRTNINNSKNFNFPPLNTAISV